MIFWLGGIIQVFLFSVYFLQGHMALYLLGSTSLSSRNILTKSPVSMRGKQSPWQFDNVLIAQKWMRDGHNWSSLHPKYMLTQRNEIYLKVLFFSPQRKHGWSQGFWWQYLLRFGTFWEKQVCDRKPCLVLDSILQMLVQWPTSKDRQLNMASEVQGTGWGWPHHSRSPE